MAQNHRFWAIFIEKQPKNGKNRANSTDFSFRFTYLSRPACRQYIVIN